MGGNGFPLYICSILIICKPLAAGPGFSRAVIWTDGFSKKQTLTFSPGLKGESAFRDHNMATDWGLRQK